MRFTSTRPRRSAKAKHPARRAAEDAAPGIQQALLSAITAMRKSIVLSKLATAIERNDPWGARDAIPWKRVGERILIGAIPKYLRQAYEMAAHSAARSLSTIPAVGRRLAKGAPIRRPRININFDVTNPEAVEWIRRHSAELIREFGESSLEAIRQIMLRSFQEGIPPAKVARMIRDAGIGLTARQERALDNFRRRLENDVELALTQEQLDNRVIRQAARYLRMRTEAIARTETITASNQGQIALWRQARAEGLLGVKAKKTWIATLDERTDDICEDLDGESVLLDESFPGGFDGPAAHVNCRCSLSIDPGED